MAINMLLPEGRMQMFHADDPKKVIERRIEEVGGIDKVQLLHNGILAVIYKRPEKTKGGIIITDNTRQEDIWQGTVGLVVAKGPLAFKDDETTKFHGQNVEIGQWVWFRPQETTRVEVNGLACRVMREYAILGIIPHPDYVF